MNISNGTIVGRLVSNQGNLTKEIRFGEILTVGPLQGYMILLSGEKLQVLFVLPLGKSGIVVVKSGKKQGGAFLLQPGQEFCLSQQGLKSSYCFEALPMFEVETADEEVCTFCRSSLTEKRGNYCLSPMLDKMETGILLCDACATAWGSSENHPTKVCENIQMNEVE
jgi:hypothetical protein